MVSRRQFLTMANGAAMAPLVADFAPHVSAASQTPPMKIEEYYSFLWLEMENVERLLGVSRLDGRTLEAGRDAAEMLFNASDMLHRMSCLAQISPV
jgi:hypothetical protein